MEQVVIVGVYKCKCKRFGSVSKIYGKVNRSLDVRRLKKEDEVEEIG